MSSGWNSEKIDNYSKIMDILFKEENKRMPLIQFIAEIEVSLGYGPEAAKKMIDHLRITKRISIDRETREAVFCKR